MKEENKRSYEAPRTQLALVAVETCTKPASPIYWDNGNGKNHHQGNNNFNGSFENPDSWDSNTTTTTE